MNYKSKIKEDIRKMLAVQNDLNDATNGEEWISGTNKHGKSIDWFRCIYMEAAEAIDSFPWKRWKSVNGKVDIDNLKIEFVDIWHFILSQEISGAAASRGVSVATPSIFDLATSRLFYFFDQAARVSPWGGASLNSRWQPEDMEQAIALFEEVIEGGIHRNLAEVTQPFFMLMRQVFTDWGEFSKLYYSKAVLNLFRQRNGYAEGKYQKNFGPNGEEDNVVMRNLFGNKITDPAELYSALEAAYRESRNRANQKG